MAGRFANIGEPVVDEPELERFITAEEGWKRDEVSVDMAAPGRSLAGCSRKACRIVGSALIAVGFYYLVGVVAQPDKKMSHDGLVDVYSIGETNRTDMKTGKFHPPGKLGISIGGEKANLVVWVTPGSWAESQGIEKGMEIVKINSHDYSNALLRQKLAGSSSFFLVLKAFATTTTAGVTSAAPSHAHAPASATTAASGTTAAGGATSAAATTIAAAVTTTIGAGTIAASGSTTTEAATTIAAGITKTIGAGTTAASGFTTTEAATTIAAGMTTTIGAGTTAASGFTTTESPPTEGRDSSVSIGDNCNANGSNNTVACNIHIEAELTKETRKALATCGDADGVGSGTLGVVCPTGYVSKSGVAKATCASVECMTSAATSTDTSTCCQARATCGDADGDGSGTSGADCPPGYMSKSGVATATCAGAKCMTSAATSTDTATCCQARAICGDADGDSSGTSGVVCPTGYVSKSGVATATCAGVKCMTSTATSTDTATCCQARATCGDADGDNSGTSGVVCPTGYVSKSGVATTTCAGVKCMTSTATSTDTSRCCQAATIIAAGATTTNGAATTAASGFTTTEASKPSSWMMIAGLAAVIVIVIVVPIWYCELCKLDSSHDYSSIPQHEVHEAAKDPAGVLNYIPIPRSGSSMKEIPSVANGHVPWADDGPAYLLSRHPVKSLGVDSLDSFEKNDVLKGEVPKNSQMYSLLKRNFDNTKSGYDGRIEVSNDDLVLEGAYFELSPPLYHRFVGKVKEFGSSGRLMFLFHGTTEEGMRKIMAHNFQKAKIGWASGSEGWYGKGFYFARRAFTAFYYNKDNRYLLCSLVVIKKILILGKMHAGGQIGPENPYNGQGPGWMSDAHLSPGEREVVIFDADQVLPCFALLLSHSDYAGQYQSFQKIGGVLIEDDDCASEDDDFPAAEPGATGCVVEYPEPE